MKRKVKEVRKTERSGQVVEDLLGYLEGSVEFIIRDCLTMDAMTRNQVDVVKEEAVRSRNK
ncbi:MAG: hypothetical protein KDD45_06760 [Bdellovibrionales bacterium]|nr:hypothetical protein [Bdellovibrionales bacterium]